MFLATIISLAMAAENFMIFDPSLSPAEVWWSKAWKLSPVALDNNYSPANLYMHVNVPVAIPAGARATISFNGLAAVSTNIAAAVAVDADQSLTFSISSLSLATGAYGPISLVISNGANGQIYAQSTNMGYFAILPALASGMTSGVLTSKWVSTAYNVSTAATLQFSFSLATNVRMYDYFVLTIDSQWSSSGAAVSWTSGSAASQAAFAGTGFAVDGRRHTVYGIQSDILGGSSALEVIFQVSGLVTPPCVRTAAAQTWSLSFYRFGSMTLLYTVAGTGPAVTTAGVAVSMTVGVPTAALSLNSLYMTTSNFVAGGTTYVKVLTTLRNAVPAAGTVTLVFTNVAIRDNTYTANANLINAINTNPQNSFYVDSSIASKFSSASADGTTVSLTVGTALAAGTSFTVYFLATVSASPTVTITSACGGNIDYVTGLSVYTFPTATATLIAADDAKEPQFNTYSAAATSLTPKAMDAGLTSNILGLRVDWTRGSALEVGGVITVNFPYNADAGTPAQQNFLYSFGANPTVAGSESRNTDIVTGTPTAGLTLALSANAWAVTLAAPYATAATGTIGFAIRSASASVFSPLFPTSKYTQYEFVFTYKKTSNSNIAAEVFVLSKPVYVKLGGATSATFSLQSKSTGCTDSTKYNFGGQVAQLKFNPFSAVPTGYTLNLVVKVNVADIGTGLTSESAMPAVFISGSTAVPNSNITISYSGGITTITVLSITSGFTAGTAVTLYFPVSEDVINKNGGATLEAVNTASGIKTDFALVIASAALSDALSAVSFTATTGVTASPATVSLVSSYTNTHNPTPAATIGTAGLSVLFPKGTGVASTATVTLAGTAISGTFYAFTSTDVKYNFAVLFNPSVSLTSGNAVSIAFTGVTSTYLFGSAISYIVQSADTKVADGAAAAGNALSLAVTIGTKTWTYQSAGTSAIGLNIMPTATYLTSYVIQVTFSDNLYGTKGASVTVQFNSALGLEYSGATVALGGAFTGAAKTITSHTASFDLVTDSGASPVFTFTVSNVGPPTSKPTAGYLITSVALSYGSVILDAAKTLTWADTIGGVNTVPLTKPTFDDSAITTLPKVTFAPIEVFPSFIGATLPYLRLEFTPGALYPAGTILTISGDSFSADSNIQQNLWVNVGYTAASISSGNLVFTLAKAVGSSEKIVVRKDNAFSANPSGTSAFWRVIGAVRGVNVNHADATTTNFTYTTANATALTNPSISVSLTTAGEPAWTNFTFTTPIALTSIHRIMLNVPGDYDANLGAAFTYPAAPSVYYLQAKSSSHANLGCYADHWVVTCNGLSSVAAGTVVSIQIWGYNPAVAGTVTWLLYVADSNMNVLLAQASLALTITAIPYLGTVSGNGALLANTDLRYVSHPAADILSTTVTLKALIADTFAVGSQAVVTFPHQFDLKGDSGASLECTALWGSVSLLSGNCAVDNNNVYFKFSNTASQTVSYVNYTEFTVKKVVRPDMLLSRSGSADLDVSKSQFTVYDAWTVQFGLGTVNVATAASWAYTGRYYRSTGAAYTGFKADTTNHIVLNAGKPISLIPGTYSAPLSLAVDALFFNTGTLKLVGSASNSNFKFDASSYVLSSTFPMSSLMVGVPTGTANGMYYLSWTLTETVVGTAPLRYSANSNTLVFVYSSGTTAFSLGSISKVPALGTGLPVYLSVGPVTPFADVSVNLASTDPNVTFTPSSVKFTSMESMLAFTISYKVASTSTAAKAFTLSLGGTDAAAFSIPSSSSFTLGNVTNLAPLISAFTLASVTQTSGALTITTNSASIVYWAFGASLAYDPEVPVTKAAIIEQTAPLVGAANENQTTTEEQEEDAIDELDIEVTTSWEDYIWELRKVANQIGYTGISLVSAANTATVLYSFSSLVANTSYTAHAWVDNYSGQENAYRSFVAYSSAPAAPAVLALAFNDTVSAADQTALLTLFTNLLGVKQGQLTAFTPGARRNLATSFSMLLSATPTSSVAPLTIANTLTSADAAKSVAAAGYAFTLTSFTPRVSVAADFPTQVLSLVYNIDEDEEEYISTTFNLTYAGAVYCVLEYAVEANLTLSTQSIIAGLDRSGDATEAWIYRGPAANNLMFEHNFTEEESPVGDYLWSCVGCNNVPLTPSCGPIQTSETITWTNGTDYAMSMVMTLLALFAYLV